MEVTNEIFKGQDHLQALADDEEGDEKQQDAEEEKEGYKERRKTRTYRMPTCKGDGCPGSRQALPFRRHSATAVQRFRA